MVFSTSDTGTAGHPHAIKKKKKNLDICNGWDQIIRHEGDETLDEMPEWGYRGGSEDFFPEISENKQFCPNWEGQQGLLRLLEFYSIFPPLTQLPRLPFLYHAQG